MIPESSFFLDLNPRNAYAIVEPRFRIIVSDREVHMTWPKDGPYTMAELQAIFEGFEQIRKFAESTEGAGTFGAELGVKDSKVIR